MEMVFPATMDSLHKMLQLVRVEARAAGFEGEVESQIELALEEALVNIIKHGYPQAIGNVEIACSRIGRVGLKVVLRDRGVPYNPLKTVQSVDRDPSQPIDLSVIGGYGIRLILSIMDHIDYRYHESQNILTLIKYL